MSLDNGLPVEESLSKVFIAETVEQLERFTQILLIIEKKPETIATEIHELFRIAHNIKGSSGMIGLNEIKETMHSVENMFDAVRNNRQELTAVIIDELLQFTDELILYIRNGDWNRKWKGSRWNKIFNTNPEKDAIGESNAQNQQEVALVLNSDEKKAVAEWQEAGNFVYGLDVKFITEALMKSVSAMTYIGFLQNWGTIFKTAPAQEDLAKEDYGNLKIVLFADSQIDPESEQSILKYPVYDIEQVTMRRWDYHPQEPTQQVIVDSKLDQTVRVDSNKIDKLINDVGELLTIKAGLTQLVREQNYSKDSWNQLAKTVQQLEQLVSDFQMEILDLRMVPVNQLFSRFPKIVRDISRKKNKPIDINFIGGETEIDKQISERLVDPLTHIIRNAADHGIEPPEERIAKGKSETGMITMKACHEGNCIVISVIDDGHGLDVAKIREKAIKNKLINETDELRENEIIKLIFEPGFSTAEEISDISGRGVGLDVVQTSIKELKGEIDIESSPNQGTTFHLKVPLTLAIIQSFMVKVGDQVFGIPSVDVVESLSIETKEIKTIGENSVFSLRSEVVPLVDLANLFEWQDLNTDNGKISVIIVRKGRHKLALGVHELLGQEEIMIKQINKAMPENPIIAGATLLGNGQIGLVLNINQIVKESLHISLDA
ncbi:MAG TPA: chemotaxis protein CheA [Bacillota bacterium]|nr:chemotaxis protein CheA [Bacillota bacterium]HOL10369.1 chemotaxis protein CheA [Bacillota bacterium]HPO98120.1 chemotaxis protein CheA [Bacillota bacterium]